MSVDVAVQVCTVHLSTPAVAVAAGPVNVDVLSATLTLAAGEIAAACGTVELRPAAAAIAVDADPCQVRHRIGGAALRWKV